MQESTRLQYLALLGIEQWQSRDAVQAPEGDADGVAAAGVDAGLPVAAVAGALDKLDALLAQPAAPLPDALAHAGNDDSSLTSPPLREEPAAPSLQASPQLSPQKASPQNAAQQKPSPQKPPQLPAGERVGCALLSLPGGLLLVADFVKPDAAGLSSAEHTMLLRLAAALVPGQAVPAPRDFSWPPAGVRVPGMDRPGAAREALRALLDEQRRRGLRDIAVLGEVAGSLFRTLAIDMGLTEPVCTLSLAAMVAEPDRKRECWAVLAPLKRGAAT